jgi:tripartite-type tricarboxylate transporter receptor subunit TctC
MKTMTAVIAAFTVLVFSAVGIRSSHAQPYPSQNVQIVITLSPGDTGDLSARAVGSELAKILKMPVVPINRTGASGAIGADSVVKARKDGYTLLYVNSNLTYAYAASPEETPYNPFTDLEPLCTAVSVPLFIAVQSESPWRTMQELIAYGRQNPGKLRGGSTGVGSVGHFGYEVIAAQTGAQIDMIPFKGAAPGMAALLGGHVEVAIPSPTLVMPHMKAGKLRLLLVSKKTPDYPNVPTLTELGYSRDISSVWFGFFLPVGVPDSVKQVLAPALEKAIKSPELVGPFQGMGTVADYRNAAEFKTMMGEEYAMVRKILAASASKQK